MIDYLVDRSYLWINIGSNNEDRIETLERQKGDHKKELLDMQELLMVVSNNSQSISTMQGKSKHSSVDEDDTIMMPTSRNIDSNLKGNDTAEFGQSNKKETEDNSDAVGVTQNLKTMRSKEENGQQRFNEESKNENIKESDGAASASKLKSSTMKRDGEVKTIERHTSQHSNQENIDEGASNFGRTISKVSNSRVLTTKRSKQFLLRAGKKGIKEELQMIQEIRELENKEKEALQQQNEALNEKIEEMNRESVKWKSIMSQKIVYLEDQIKKLKTANIQAIDNLK